MKCDLRLLHGQRVELFLIISLFIWLTRSLSCGMQTLSCNTQDLAPQPGIETGPSALGMRHIITRGSPESGVPIGKHGTTCMVGFLCPSLPHCGLHSTTLTGGPLAQLQVTADRQPPAHSRPAGWCCGVPAPPWRYHEKEDRMGKGLL